ncbi:MAG: hypothetical protein LBE03_02755, partial [Candidatus Nomurabacteria bacterium]|nr:hypothetical protein [Candidatus Nomurabacteria bacterium]
MERRLGQTAAESASEEERQAFIDRYGFDPENLQVAMVDQSHDAREFARDYADHKLNQELGNAKGFKGFFERVWKGGYAKEYYRQKYARQALEDIKSSQNIYAKEGNEDEATQARLDTIRRFQSEYEEMIHQDNGEQKRDVTHEDSPKIAELKAAIEVFARSDGGQTARNNLEEARKRIVREFATDGNEGSADLVMIDNLTDIAEQARLAVDHGFAIENVMNGMQIINGESRSGVRGEAGLSKVDKVIEKLQAKSRGLVNPATIAIGISIAAAGLKIAEQGGIGRLASIVAPGVAGAMFAGNNERIKLKEERAQHMREKAQGKKMPENDKARAELDATIYDMRGAGEMTTELNNILEFLNNLPQDRALTPEEDNQCIAARSSLIAIDARIRLSDREGVELVSYSDVMKVDAERFALDEARAKTRKALMDYTRNSNPNTHDARGGDEAMRAAFLMDTQQVEEIIKQGEISNKDKLYKKLRNRRVAKAALVAGATGFVIGVGTQEAMAFFSSNVLGG